MNCLLTADFFRSCHANDPFLDENWKCRVCGMLAGAHLVEVHSVSDITEAYPIPSAPDIRHASHDEGIYNSLTY
jgi:hypothetical protein